MLTIFNNWMLEKKTETLQFESKKYVQNEMELFKQDQMKLNVFFYPFKG